MDIEKFKEQSSGIMKNGMEATKKMDGEVKEFSGKIPQYILDSTDLILYSSIMSLPPQMMMSVTKMLCTHCDHLYMVGFLHGKEVGKEEGMEEMSNYFINADADNLKN